MSDFPATQSHPRSLAPLVILQVLTSLAALSMVLFAPGDQRTARTCAILGSVAAIAAAVYVRDRGQDRRPHLTVAWMLAGILSGSGVMLATDAVVLQILGVMFAAGAIMPPLYLGLTASRVP